MTFLSQSFRYQILFPIKYLFFMISFYKTGSVERFLFLFFVSQEPDTRARGDAKVDISRVPRHVVPKIDLHTIATLGIQYGSENISRGKHARVTSD